MITRGSRSGSPTSDWPTSWNMAGMEQAIEATLRSPERVVSSLSDPQAQLYYRFYFGTRVGDRYLCVVVKVAGDDAFVLTAYLTDRIKRGVALWPRES